MSSLRITDEETRARQQIEDGIVAHRLAITKLHRRLNSFILINRLPPELLTEIFRFCRDGPWGVQWHDGAKFKGIGSPMRWIILVGVCSHWREVALQAPMLWARINLDFPRFTKECSLVRSRNSPLHFTAKRWNTEQSALFNDIASHMNHVHSIDFDISHSNRLTGHGDVLPSVTSPVTSIRIQGNQQMIPSFLGMFAKCEFPAIERLELVDCFAVLPQCLLGRTLKRLTLHTRTSQFVNPVELVRGLSQMHQLEFLHIQGVSFREQPNTQAPILLAHKVPLLGLHQLILQPPHRDNAQKEYISFLTNVELSPETLLDLKFEHSMPDADISSLLQITSELLRRQTFHSLSLCNVGSAFAVGFWEEAVNPGVMDLGAGGGEQKASFCLWLHFSLQTRKIAWDGLLHVVDLSHVETIHFGDLAFNKDILSDWRRLLRTCHLGKKLSIKGSVAWILVQVLRETEQTKTDGGNTVTRPIMPRLEVVYLKNVVWRTLENAEAEENGKFIQWLLLLIKARDLARLPIKKFLIKKCVNMESRHVDLLRSKGRKVVWDKHIEYEEDEDEDEDEFDEDEDSDDPYGLRRYAGGGYYGDRMMYGHWF